MPWKGGSIICNIIFKSTYQSLSPFLFSFSLPSESLYIHVISSISEFGPKFWSLLFMYVLDILQRLCLNPVNTFYCWVRQIKLWYLWYAFNLSIKISNIKLFPSSHQFSLGFHSFYHLVILISVVKVCIYSNRWHHDWYIMNVTLSHSELSNWAVQHCNTIFYIFHWLFILRNLF